MGGAVGREVRPAAQSLSLLRQRKEPKKGDPTGRVPCAALRGSLRCSGLGRRCGTRCAPAALRSNNRSESVHKAWACCAAQARPSPCASRHGQRGSREQHGPSLRSASKSGFQPKAERSDGPCVPPHPSVCAEARSGRGERVRRRTRTQRDLTRRSCLSGGPQARSEFCGAPRPRAPQLARSEAEGRRQQGRLSFAYFSLATQRKVGAPPGALPGQRAPLTPPP